MTGKFRVSKELLHPVTATGDNLLNNIYEESFKKRRIGPDCGHFDWRSRAKLLCLGTRIAHQFTEPGGFRFQKIAEILRRGAHRLHTHGLQPLATLTANGVARVEVGVRQPVTLAARLEMPPQAGKIVQYAWYLGAPDFRFEPTVQLSKPRTAMHVKRTVSFDAPGEYSITLRVEGQRDGTNAVNGTTLLQNVARVRVVVR